MAEPRAWRNSRVSLRRECGWAYKRAYIDNESGVASPSLLAGQNVHGAVAETIRHLLRDGVVDVHRVAHATVRGGDAEYHDALEVVSRLQEALGVEWDIDIENVLFVEERLSMEIQLRNGDVDVFRGTPDLVERTGQKSVRITDWKTHWHPETEHQFRAGQQLKRYALLVADHYPGFQSFELVKRFVRYRNASYTETLRREDLHAVRERLISEIEETIQFEERGEFKPTPGSWCALCREHSTCPVILRYREQGVDDISIPDDARASELAGDALALDAARQAIQERLKRYLGADHMTGSVPVTGGTYGYGPVRHRSVPADRLRSVLEENRLDTPDELWNTDLDVLDRLSRKLPDTVTKAIDAITIHSQSSQCGFRRATVEHVAAGAAVQQEEVFQ